VGSILDPKPEAQSVWRVRCVKPCFETNHVPIVANIAMMIPEGIVVLFVPAPLLDTKSGPHTDAIATEIHITKIESDAHISATRTRFDQCGVSDEIPLGGWEIVDIPHLLPSASVPRTRTRGIRGDAELPAWKY
jgi:hypothetical protein